MKMAASMLSCWCKCYRCTISQRLQRSALAWTTCYKLVIEVVGKGRRCFKQHFTAGSWLRMWEGMDYGICQVVTEAETEKFEAKSVEKTELLKDLWVHYFLRISSKSQLCNLLNIPLRVEFSITHCDYSLHKTKQTGQTREAEYKQKGVSLRVH